MTTNPHSVLLYLRPARLIYVRVTGPYEQSVPRAWEKLCAWFRDNDVALPHGKSYGFAHDNPADVGRMNCRYDACFAITPNIDDRAINELAVTTLRGGAYACRRFSGSFDISATIKSIYADFEPLAGLAFDANRPVLSAHMGNPMQRGGGDTRFEICAPVIAADDFQRATVVA